MPDSSAERDPLDCLAEEFVARFRAGERPSLTEYADRLPERADEVRDLFPALVEIEQLKPVTVDQLGSSVPVDGLSDPDHVGEFCILRRVGHGGMGVVYEAVQQSLGRHVALKLLPAQSFLDPKRLERFHREAKAAAQLHHTNIVPVFGVGEAEGWHYYVMQFIAGHPLDAVIKEVRRLKQNSAPAFSRAVSDVAVMMMTATFAPGPESPDPAPAGTVGTNGSAVSASPPSSSGPPLSGRFSDEKGHYCATVARIGEQVAEALAYAHGQGILHRDIKPSNLLLDLRGTVWVTDFGLAKSTDTDDLTQVGDFVGTLRYMAPERFEGRGDHRADVYALGLTLYELLTLEPAFHAENRAKLVEQVIAATPRVPRSLNPAIPRDLETIVLKATQRDPSMRYQSAQDLAADLRRYLEDRPIRARRASTIEHAWRWCRRNQAVASLMAVIGFMLVVAAVFGTVAAARFKARADVAIRAKKDADDARKEVSVQLWRSQLSEARANTRSGLPGQRFQSLELLKTAHASARASGSLSEEDRKQFRDVAVAALALPDLEIVHEVDKFPAGSQSLAVDATFSRYALCTAGGAVTIRRVDDGAELFAIPATGQRSTVSLSDSGKLLVVCDDYGVEEDKRVGRVYRLDGSEPELLYRTFMLHGSSVFVTPDDRRVVYPTRNAVNVWDRDTGGAVSWPLPGRQIGRTSLSRDGRRLAYPCATDTGGILHVRDMDTGRVVADLPLPAASDWCALSPDGRVVAITLEQTIHLWDVEAKREIRVLEGHRNLGVVTAFDQTGERLISNDWSSSLRVWDWRNGKQLLNLPSAWFSHSRLVSADGRLFTHSQDGRTLWVLKLAPGLERRPFGPLSSKAYSMRVDPKGRFGVITLVKEREYGNLVVTDLDRGIERGRFSAGRGEQAFQIATDSAILTNGFDGNLRWPQIDGPETGVIRFGPPQRLRPELISDRHSASADGRLVVMPNFDAGAVALRADRIAMPLYLGPQEDVRYTAVSPNGRFVATGTHGGTTPIGVKVWDSRNGARVAEFQALGGLLTFSPDSRWLASTGGGLRLWRTDNWTVGPLILEGDKASGCVFSPDSQVLAVGGHASVRLVRVDNGTELARLPFLEQARFFPQCFSPDGSKLYALNIDTAELAVWDLRQLRAELSDLGLDWEVPPLKPPTETAPLSRVEFIGTESLSGSMKWTEYERLADTTSLLANPFDASAYTRLGYSKLIGGSPADALKLLDLAIVFDPRREDARLHRARAHLQLREYDLAAADATFVLERFPHQLTARQVRAAACRRLGRSADAIADLTAVLRVYPLDITAILDRAAAYEATGETEKAERDLRRAEEVRQGAPKVAINDLAWRLVTGPPQTRNPRRALELMTELFAGTTPAEQAVLNTLGVVQYRNGLFNEAVGTLKKSLAAGHGQFDAFDLYFLAMAHAKLGETAKARDFFERAVKWHEARRETLAPQYRQELDEFRSEATDLLGGK